MKVRFSLLVFSLFLLALPLVRVPEAHAQASTAETTTPHTSRPFVPLLLDPARMLERKDLPRTTTLRFVTEEDFPPFNYIGRNGELSGFNIDLARAICAELAVQCTIQPRRWDLLLTALDKGEADAVIAGHRITADLRAHYAVSLPTHRSPARFVAKSDAASGEASVAALAGKSVAVVGGSAHEAYLNALFPRLRLLRFATQDAALLALQRGEADIAFGDGVALAFWLNGAQSSNCCAFLGGPFTESRYFGEGAGIVMRPGAQDLRSSVNYALLRINRDGRYTRFYLKHFPVSYW